MVHNWVSEYKCANCYNTDCPGMIKINPEGDDYQITGHCPDGYNFRRFDDG